jgi:CO/xanthine dehydrogenase FAD-binding subunit
MKPASFAFHSPDSPHDALGPVASLSNARVIAGVQSLMPMLDMRLVMPDHVVDLNGIASPLERQALSRTCGDDSDYCCISCRAPSRESLCR